MVVQRKRLRKTDECKTGYERSWKSNRCIKKCDGRKNEARGMNNRCYLAKKAGYIRNPVSNRLVKKDGATGRFVRGLGPDPMTNRGATKKKKRKSSTK